MVKCTIHNMCDLLGIPFPFIGKCWIHKQFSHPLHPLQCPNRELHFMWWQFWMRHGYSKGIFLELCELSFFGYGREKLVNTYLCMDVYSRLNKLFQILNSLSLHCDIFFRINCLL